MRIAITHTTTYRYEGAARLTQALRLRPADTRAQRVAAWEVRVSGAGTALHYVDAFGNQVDLAVSHGPVAQVEIVAEGVVETSDLAGVVGPTGEAVVPAVYLRSTPLTATDPAIAEFARGCLAPDTLATLHALLDGLHAAVAYDTSATASDTTAASSSAARRGVCQDHAHIFIAGARSLGIPARYATGYLLTDEAGSAIAHHAWAEALAPGIGWIGFDPANGQCPTDRYVRLAVGLDAVGAAPIRGVRQGVASEALFVGVEVRPDDGGQSQRQQ